MKTVTLENLGLKGINSDQTPWSMPPEYISDGINFRITSNAVESSYGYALWSTAPVDFFAGYLLHVQDITGSIWLVLGRTAAYAYNGTWSDVSSVIGYGSLGLDDELLWTSCLLGAIPVVNNPQASPEYWSPVSPSQVLQPLPFDAADDWLAKGYSCKVMRSHKNFLFALGLTEGAVEIPSGYRWSHPADINGLPFTWDETDPSSLAGKAQLGGDSGAIVDGLSLRDSFVIYSQTGIDILDFANNEFVFRRRELSSTVGLNSSNCIVEVKGKHYFIGDGDILVNDGNTISSILHNRLRKSFTARLNADTFNRSYAVRNNALKEIWFCVPETSANYPNRAYIYNWVDDSWAIRELPELTPDLIGEQITFANYGAQSEPADIWDEWTGTWDSQLRVWGSAKRTPLNDTIIGAAVGSKLYFLDPTDDIEGRQFTQIERVGLALETQRVVTSITEIIPHIRGTGEVQIQFGSQDYAGGPVRWKEPVAFRPEEMRKVNIRTTGELHCYRVGSNDDSTWQFSGMDITYKIEGTR